MDGGITLAGLSVRGSVSQGGLIGHGPAILVKYAADLPLCEGCEEPWCEEHGEHFAECECVGPHQDDEYDYEEKGGKLFAVKRAT